MSRYAIGRAYTDDLSSHSTRQTSLASTASAFSAASSVFGPTRQSTVTSTTSSSYSIDSLRHKRGVSEADMPIQREVGKVSSSVDNSPDRVYKTTRRSLRPLPQAPNASSIQGGGKRKSSYHERAKTIDQIPQVYSDDPFTSQCDNKASPEPALSRPHIRHTSTSPHHSTFKAPDLQELQKSSTSYLRTLSRFAETGEGEEYGLTSPTPAVVGLHNRRQLKRNDSGAGHRRPGAVRDYGWGARNWMDKQRQFLQAYEYLCHIGEAKEWIEDVIQKTIPPVVQLEEALRDGVTLAEIVQAFHPDQHLRIFRNPKLQYKHSENINLFFRFADDVGLPDLFRFEFIDLYEKKNIPKVIYCIHALSWLLYRKGMVEFRIGNLVGQLEFEQHELESTQRGLDKAGVSMPSFSGMGQSFGAPPEPEPVETEEERQDRELHENEPVILDLQSQMRGALVRLRLGDMMQTLWDNEELLVELQSRIRGDWARQVTDYKLSMNRFATSLQASARGFLVRTNQQRIQQTWMAREKDITKIQSLIRARKARAQTKQVKTDLRLHTEGIKELQAAIRGALARRDVFDQYEAARETESELPYIQGAVRGMLLRKQLEQDQQLLRAQNQYIVRLQACIRASLLRKHQAQQKQHLIKFSPQWTALQALIRAHAARTSLEHVRKSLKSHKGSVTLLQANIRGANAREHFNALRLALLRQSASTVPLQAHIQGFLLRRRQQAQRRRLEGQVHSIKQFQAACRGALLREDIGQTIGQLEDVKDSIIQAQSVTRAVLERMRIGVLLAELDEHEDSVTELQALIRAGLVRTRFEEKKKFFKENMEKVVKIQSIVRAKIQGKAYKSLTSGKNPPVNTLKSFVHLLNDSDFDFDEEIEFERLRKLVVQQVRQNELADQYLAQLDIKIALLVKNKITLDEVIKHQRHFGGHVGRLLHSSDIGSQDPSDLKALNKTSRKKLEHYQELFFLLQTQPHYLARLFRIIREQTTPEKELEHIKHVVMGMFGYAQKRREEYYLVKLIVRSFKEEIDCSSSLQDYLRTTTFGSKLFGAYIRSPRDRKFLRDVIGPLVKEHFIDNLQLDLESDPLQIYLSIMNNEELRTGRRSGRNPNIPREEAIRDPDTRATFIKHMQDLRDIADQFLLCLEDCLNRMPFGVRFIAQQMHENLVTRYPGEDAGHALQLVGQWLWRTYLQPALLEPEKFGVVDRAMTQEQKKNLGEVAKVLNQVASCRGFGGDNVYLQPLNSYIAESVPRLCDLWQEMISIPPAEEHYDIDEFNDLYAKVKPTLYIKMADIFSVHKLLSSQIGAVCMSPDDALREVLGELGSVQSNESALGGVSRSEIMLTLSPKYLNAEDPDAEVKALWTVTKRCVLYIIRIQTGSSLLDILVKTPTPEDEVKWATLISEELRSQRGAYSDATHNHSVLDITSLSYAELKRIALENVQYLIQIGRLTQANGLQDILNAIAFDIRMKHRRRVQRQRELENVKLTLQRLNEQAAYLEGQLKTYNDYIEQAMLTLQKPNRSKRFVLPFTKQWEHEREMDRTGRSFKFGSYKYSARKLADKGVLVHWKGYNERQWDRIDLTISSEKIGVFLVEGSSGNMMIPGATATVTLDELLQMQFDNRQWMDMFKQTGSIAEGLDGDLRVNNVATIELPDMYLKIWDVGGQMTLRRLWTSYYKSAHAVVFVVDSTDLGSGDVEDLDGGGGIAGIGGVGLGVTPGTPMTPWTPIMSPLMADFGRLEECRAVLESVLSHQDTAGIPILVLANKQDREDCLEVVRIKEGFVRKVFEGEKGGMIRDSRVLPVSALKGTGVKEAVDWVKSRVLWNKEARPPVMR
ncbi:hypothetical protein DV738_g1998, partial [Chaetothyriales sp. CBS 135597]